MSELARRYAQALYAVSPDEQALLTSARSLTGDPLLWEVLCSPAVQPWEKERVLGRLPQLSDSGPLLGFYRLLARKERLPLLPQIVEAFEDLSLEARGAARCRMTCVRIPEPAMQEKLRQMLCRLHHKKDILFTFQVDPALLGGFTLELEGVTYDKSVRGALAGLARQLEERRMA